MCLIMFSFSTVWPSLPPAPVLLCAPNRGDPLSGFEFIRAFVYLCIRLSVYFINHSSYLIAPFFQNPQPQPQP